MYVCVRDGSASVVCHYNNLSIRPPTDSPQSACLAFNIHMDDTYIRLYPYNYNTGHQHIPTYPYT